MFRVWQSTEKSCKTSGLEAEQGDEGGDVELEDDGDEVANEAEDGTAPFCRAPDDWGWVGDRIKFAWEGSKADWVSFNFLFQ